LGYAYNTMPRGKKILYLITKANWGGAQRYVFDLACAAKDAGHEVAVAYGEHGLLATKLHEQGIRTIEVAGLARDMHTASDAGALGAIRTLLARERPEIFHVNSSKAGGLGALAGRLEGVPRIIFTAHGWAFNESRSAFSKLLIRIAAGMTVYLSHETICVSGAIKRDLRWLPFAQKKLIVIKNGIACRLPRPRADARATLLESAQEKFWIGMVSELHPIKRIEDAIDAMAILALRYPDAILVVCGEGELRRALEERIARHGLADRVFLLGFVEDAPSYLSAFDIFVQASQSEALGLAVLEAGCAALPVVGTRVGGIPEIIESSVSGLLVPPRSSAAIARALALLIDDPDLRARYGKTLEESVRADFSLERMARETLARYAA